MSEYRVASRYAKSLIDLSKEQGSLDVVYKDMKDFLDTLKRNTQIEVLLKSPVITGDNKMAVLKKIFEKAYHKNTMALFDIVVRKNRAMFLHAIAQGFIEQYNTLNNIMKASVKTAYAIDDKLREEVKQFIEKYSGKKVELQTIVDPQLIGGLVIQMGDKLFDASIAGKLSKAKKELLNTYISK
jgi:F-type H+-transporting ATPase subunit delta